MIIGFDASRAFVSERTGTENYSFQLLRHLTQIDTENEYYVYVRPQALSSQFSEKRSFASFSSTKFQTNYNEPSLNSPLAPSSRNGSSSKQFENLDIENSLKIVNCKLEIKGKIIENFKVVPINFPRLWTQIGLAAQTFIDPIDILFVPSHTLPIIRRPGLKTVVTVHDLGAEFLPKMHQLKQRLYLKAMTHYQLKTATRIIAVSHATKKDLVEKIGLNPDKIDVVHEGIDIESFASVKRKAESGKLKKYHLINHNYFLFVGTIQPRKNLERVIQAYWNLKCQITNAKLQMKNKESDLLGIGSIGNLKLKIPQLVLVGARGWLSEDIYKLPKRLGIEEYVVFLGRVPDEDLPSLYNGALAFVYPSLFEGFGLPILEAMASGCPVITSSVSSMPEVAGKAALLVDPYSVDQIAKAMLTMLKDQKSRNQFIKLGQARVKQFSWANCAKSTLRILKEVGKEG